MTEIDTSAEAVNRLAADLCARWDDEWTLLECRVTSAATLRSLAAERDAARAEAARLRGALEIIAGQRQCIDNLLGNEDVARIALTRGTSP